MNSKKVKFLIVSSAYPYRGGISDSTHSFCNELVKSGNEIEVWTYKLLYPTILFPGKTQFSKVKYAQNFHIKRVINTLNPFNWIYLTKEINRLNPKYIVLRYWSPILSFPYFFMTLFIKRNITVIGLIDNWKNHEKLPLEFIFRKLIENSCNRFITFSENVSNHIRSESNKKVNTLFHPINNNLPNIKESKAAKKDLQLDDTKYISFIGLIRKYKGLKTFIESISYLKENNLRFIIAGEFYDSKKEYDELINKFNLSDRIIVKDQFLSLDELRDLICASELIIQPYLKASQSGIIPLAYNYNTPLIVSNINGLKEIISNDGSGLVFESTPKNLAEAIINALDKEKYQYLLNNIMDKKKNYTWSTFVERFNKELI